MKLSEIRSLIETVCMIEYLCGSTADFGKRWREFCIELGQAICEEKRITAQEAFFSLPPDTEFSSPRVIEVFKNLRSWLATQHSNFKEAVS